MEVEFSGAVRYWRGPAPWYFVTVPEAECERLESTAAMVSYGWGMIPVTVRIGATSWATALWPKDGAYVVPVKAAVRRSEGIEEGDTVEITLTVGV